MDGEWQNTFLDDLPRGEAANYLWMSLQQNSVCAL
jgi:hypothetical protein